MTKKILPSILLFIVTLLQPLSVFAQKEDAYISNFQSDIVVEKDGYVFITEKITYEFNESRHGMYRDIPIATS